MVEEQYKPDCTILPLTFTEKQAEKTSRKTSGKMLSEKTIKNKQLIVEFLKKNGDKSAVEISGFIGLNQ